MSKQTDQKKTIQELIQQGENFTYANFSNKGEHGYPSSLTPEFSGWKVRCQSIIEKLFSKNSPQYRELNLAYRIKLIGNGENNFRQLVNTILGVLTVAIHTIDENIFDEIPQENILLNKEYSSDIFIVHGHDENLKQSVEIFLKEIGLNPIVLHRKPDEGLTIIEKLEKNSDVGYAFILLTPDEIAYLISEDSLEDEKRKKEKRARPNVVLELGYFFGKLGRGRVCCLYKGGVTLPSDVQGLIYKEVKTNIEEIGFSIIKDLQAAGYKILQQTT